MSSEVETFFDSFSTEHYTPNCVWRSFTSFRMTERGFRMTERGFWMTEDSNLISKFRRLVFLMKSLQVLQNSVSLEYEDRGSHSLLPDHPQLWNAYGADR